MRMEKLLVAIKRRLDAKDVCQNNGPHWKDRPLNVFKDRQVEGNSQDNNTQNHRARTQFALAGTAIRERIAARLCLLVLLGLRFSLALARSDVRRNSHPCTEPQHGKKTVERREGVDVAEPSGPRPHGDRDEIDQGGDGDPALWQQREIN